MGYPEVGQRIVESMEKRLCAVKGIRLVYRNIDIMSSYYRFASACAHPTRGHADTDKDLQ